MATARRNHRKEDTYEFTLVLGRKPRITDRIANVLYEAGCDDASVITREGIGHLAFDRASDSYRHAILSAIADVEGAGVGLRVERVETEEENKENEEVAAANAWLELRRRVPVAAEEWFGTLLPQWS